MGSPHPSANPAHRSQLPPLRRWIRALLDLDEDTAVFLHEFAVPGDSAGSERRLRTVITLQSLHGETRSWTVPHGLALLTAGDVTTPRGIPPLDTAAPGQQWRM